MLKIKVQNLDETLKRFDRMGADLKKASAKAITQIGSGIQAALTESMPKTFDRPTPFTMRSIFLWQARADKEPINAVVGIKDFKQKDDWKREHYLDVEIEGGGRDIRRFEVAIAHKKFYVLPVRNFPLDRYGNIGLGRIRSFIEGRNNTLPGKLSDLSSGGEADFISSGAGKLWFLSHKEGKLRPGLYKTIGRGKNRRIQMLLYATEKQPQYRPLFDFFGIAKRTFEDISQKIFGQVMEEALKK
jgi:hypothetical protein